MDFLNGSFFKFLFGFVGLLVLGFIFFFAANYYDVSRMEKGNAAGVELSQ